MKNPKQVYADLLANAEQNSIRLLVEKMGISREEVLEICAHSGVTAFQLVERMQLSKYRFLYTNEQRCCPPPPLKVIRLPRNRVS